MPRARTDGFAATESAHSLGSVSAIGPGQQCPGIVHSAARLPFQLLIDHQQRLQSTRIETRGRLGPACTIKHVDR